MTSYFKTTSALALISTVLMGCVTQNKFADSVTQYNLQTEQAQDRALLLNVLRASRRRPLLFFDISTVTGSSPASGSLATSIPLAAKHATVLQGMTTTPTLNLSGGPSVAAAPILTQDFYNGMLKPISMSNIDLFVKRGVSRDLLFTLFFQKIEFATDDGVKDIDKAWSVELTNYPGLDDRIAPFQRAVEWLVDTGLTTEKSDKDASGSGPYFLSDDLTGGDTVAKAGAAGLAPVETGWCDLDIDAQLGMAERVARPNKPAPALGKAAEACKAFKAAETAAGTQVDMPAKDAEEAANAREAALAKALHEANVPTSVYSLAKPDSSPDIKFAFHSPNTKPLETKTSPKGHVLSLAAVETSGANATGIKHDLCAFLDKTGSDNFTRAKCEATDLSRIKITITPRSTYTLIYYLGELARRNLYPDYPDKGAGLVAFRALPSAHLAQPETCVARYLAKDAPVTANYISMAAPSPTCRPLMDIALGDEPGFMNVDYDGRRFVIPDTHLPTQNAPANMTNEVFDIVAELVNVNRSSKDVPTSNVLTLQGVP